MKKKWLIAGLLGAALIFFGGLAFLYRLPLDLRERSPLQPLLFSHKIHAGENGIPCLFCHRFATKSPTAGLPPVATCMTTCHPIIKLEIKELADYWNKREPIPWKRVHVLPDHVYFPHMMHTRAGIDCADCHGNVAAMEPLTRFSSLKMGWCLDCHRRKSASIDCWACHK